MGGKSGDNGQMIRMQKQQAEESRAKEAARAARIQEGLARIKAAFQGQEKMRSTTNRFRATGPAAGVTAGTAVSGLPAGYSYVRGAAPAPKAKTPSYVGGHGATQPAAAVSGRSGGQSAPHEMNQPATASTGAGQGEWLIQGPDGRTYKIGEDILYSGQEGTGEFTGGFDDAFYNKYRNKITDYYLPQVADEFGEAKEDLTYKLARAGTLNSSAAIDKSKDLAKQNVEQENKIKTQADTATADLRSRVAAEQAKAEAQLYATENPEVAANQALAAVRNISLDQPELSPLSGIFNLATIGAAGLGAGYTNQKLRNKYNQPVSAGREVV